MLSEDPGKPAALKGEPPHLGFDHLLQNSLGEELFSAATRDSAAKSHTVAFWLVDPLSDRGSIVETARVPRLPVENHRISLIAVLVAD